MSRAKTCASGKNSSALVWPMNTAGRLSTALVAPYKRLRWVRAQPFGRPVVPDV